MKKVLALVAVLVTLLAAFLIFVYVKVGQVGSQIVVVDPSTQPLIIHLQKGQSAHTVWSRINQKKSSSSAVENIYFKLWLRLHPEMAGVKAGYYIFDSSQSVHDIFKRIEEGRQTQFSIALVEGLTFAQWKTSIQQIATLKQDLPDSEALYEMFVAKAGFCKNDKNSLEGCLLADTYFYHYQDSALSVLLRAYTAMDSLLDLAWSQRYRDIPLNTPYEALIMASIVEKETALASERDVISGVFSNRLELGMRLQTDPTVIYGIGETFDGNITRAHLREKTEYNTYRIDGLPPTPIAMASRASLMAAVQPALTEYIYFVARGDGSHQFSVSLDEHNQAVRQFQLNR